MKLFLNPDKIDILCNKQETYIKNTKEVSYITCEKAESKQSVWTKITSKVKGVWEKVKPVITGLTAFFTSATALLRAVNKFRTQCRNMKGVFA